MLGANRTGFNPYNNICNLRCERWRLAKDRLQSGGRYGGHPHIPFSSARIDSRAYSRPSFPCKTTQSGNAWPADLSTSMHFRRDSSAYIFCYRPYYLVFRLANRSTTFISADFLCHCRSGQINRNGSRSSKASLTPRSSGAPTAGHQARAGGTRYIFTSPGLASCRRRPLSSNVRPHSQPPVAHQPPKQPCPQSPDSQGPRSFPYGSFRARTPH